MKLKLKFDYIILIFLFLSVLGFRLYFTFKYSNFNTDEAYFHLRQIEYFSENYRLLIYDELSYGGRNIFYPPLFPILMALISFGSMFMLKLIPEIFLSLTVFIVYKIAKEISGNSYAALLAAAFASFIPILFTETLNNLSVYSFVIPLLLLMLYSLFNLEDKKYFWCFILSSFLLPLIHPSALIFVITVVFYFFLIAGGALTAAKIKKEAVIFSVLLIILFEFIIYKKAFMEFGANILKENIPSNILADSFRQLTPVDILISVGILPLILGSVGIYICFVLEKRKIAYMFGAFTLSILLLIVFRLLTITIGLMFLGIALSIFTAPAVARLFTYLSKLKFNYLHYVIIILLLVSLFVSSILPSYLAAKESAVIDNIKIKEVEWLGRNTNPDDIILANVDEGNLIASIAKRKTIVDTNFLFAPDPVQRLEDIKVVYTTISEAIALNILKKYDVDVIYLSDDTRRQYNLLELSYAEKEFQLEEDITKGSSCFEVKRRGTYYVVKC